MANLKGGTTIGGSIAFHTNNYSNLIDTLNGSLTLSGSITTGIATTSVFGGAGNNQASIHLDCLNAGSPQITFTEYGDMSWAVGGDDADNSFKIHGNATSTPPIINNLAVPFFEITTAGAVIASSTITADNFILSSDIELKENIKPIKSNHIDNVSIVEFNFKDKPDKKRQGVIAQELEKFHPEMIYEDKNGYKSVDYTSFLLAKIAQLEKRIKILESR